MSLFYSTLTHRGGVVGNFFFSIQYKSVLTVTLRNCLYFGGFSSGNFCGISALEIWQILSSYPLHILIFSLILKGCNIGQEIWREKNYKLKKEELQRWIKRVREKLRFKKYWRENCIIQFHVQIISYMYYCRHKSKY